MTKLQDGQVLRKAKYCPWV